MPGSAIWQTSHGPDVLVCPHNRHAKTKSMPVMSAVSSHLPPMSSEARAFINNVCDGGETIGEESRNETEQKAKLDQRDPLEAEIGELNAVARQMKAGLKKRNGIVPNLVQSALGTEPNQQQYQQQEPELVKTKSKKQHSKQTGAQRKASRQEAEEKKRYMQQCEEVDRLNKVHRTVVTQDLNPLVAAICKKLTELEKKPQKRKNPSPAEQDLALQIQSGAQRGEQMRREVESFAEGTLAKTAAVVFADIIVQRILNPKAT